MPNMCLERNSHNFRASYSLANKNIAYLLSCMDLTQDAALATKGDLSIDGAIA